MSNFAIQSEASLEVAAIFNSGKTTNSVCRALMELELFAVYFMDLTGQILLKYDKYCVWKLCHTIWRQLKCFLGRIRTKANETSQSNTLEGLGHSESQNFNGILNGTPYHFICIPKYTGLRLSVMFSVIYNICTSTFKCSIGL